MISTRRGFAVAVFSILLSGSAVGLASVPADAAPGPVGNISQVKYEGGVLSFNFLGTEGEGLGTAIDLKTDQPRLRLNPVSGGAPTTLTPEAKLASVSQVPTFMLVLDTSGSMLDDKKFQLEQAAALNFLKQVRDDAEVGLTEFGSPARNILAPTSDHQLVAERIRQLSARKSNGTDLLSAVSEAAKAFSKDDGLSVMVMVTDGDDAPGSTGVQPRVTKAKRLSNAREAITNKGVQFLGLLVGGSIKRSDLEAIAAGNLGRVDEASLTGTAEGLDQLLGSGVSATDKTLRFSAKVPAGLTFSGLVDIEAVALDSSDREVKGTIPTELLSKPVSTRGTTQASPQSVIAEGSMINTPVMIGALIALFLAMAILVASTTTAVTAGESRESEVSRRLAFYTLGGNRGKPVAVQEDPRLSDSRLARSAVNLVNRIARQRKLDQALDARLEKAGLPIRTAEWTLLHLGIAVGSALLLLVATRGRLIGAILGLALGLAIPWLFLGMRTSMRERKFLAQLPDTLQLLAGSLAAGYSMPQAMDAVLRESQAPISVEFNRALIETRLGMPPEDALEGIATRTASKDFSWVVMAIRIQREVGGNLAELLSTVAETLRERERLRRQVSALSAEGRLSGVILGALPLVFALFLIITKPDYISPLFDDPRGWILLGGGAILLAAGSFWMSRLVKVEV